jgi:hypothetical protein
MKPKAMDRAELLDRVMNNYRRFYMKKALFHYPWRGTGFRRRYLLDTSKNPSPNRQRHDSLSLMVTAMAEVDDAGTAWVLGH